MKQFLFLPTVLCILLLLGCSNNDDESPALDLNNCNVLAFEAYALMIERATEYGENPTTDNCNLLKESAQNVKSVFIQCNLWEDEEGNIQDEVEDIVNLHC